MNERPILFSAPICRTWRDGENRTQYPLAAALSASTLLSGRFNSGSC